MEYADKCAVAETLYHYATDVDRRDWARYRSLFTDTVTLDFSSFGPDLPLRVMSADDYVAGVVEQFTGLAATQHSMTNPLVTVEGDAAAITMYVRAHHVHDPDIARSWYTVGGYYDDTLVRVDNRWLLTGVRLTVTWRAADPAIMELARRRREAPFRELKISAISAAGASDRAGGVVAASIGFHKAVLAFGRPMGKHHLQRGAPLAELNQVAIQAPHDYGPESTR